MDTTKVSIGEMIAGASALALFVFMFLPWYSLDEVGGVSVGQFGGDLSAWEAFSFIDLLLFLAAAVVIGIVVAKAADALPELPQSPDKIVMGAGVVALILVVFRLIFTPGLDTGALDVDVDLGRKIGIFFGLLASAGIAYGGWRATNEPAGAAGSIGSGAGAAGSSTPPPAPAGGAPAAESHVPPTPEPPAPTPDPSPPAPEPDPVPPSTPPADPVPPTPPAPPEEPTPPAPEPEQPPRPIDEERPPSGSSSY